MEEYKQCEQCNHQKSLSAFHRRKNKTDGRMKICADCYMVNLHKTFQNQRDAIQKWKKQEGELLQAREEQQAEESKRAHALLPTLLQGTSVCQTCQQEFPTNARGLLVVPYFSMHSTTCKKCENPYQIQYHQQGWVSYRCTEHSSGVANAWYESSEKECPSCYQERRKKNRQAYPLCQICMTPTDTGDFLKDYQGYRLDIIRVCCKTCASAFHALLDHEQLALLRRAMVKTYGETATIYALQYNDTFTYHHIGRTKHLKRRMAEYRRNWHREIYASHVLEEISFGPLSMERESRWILHALKQGWPIDNFDIIKDKASKHSLSSLQEVHSNVTMALSSHQAEIWLQRKKELTAAIADFDPLTAPFETIEPLLKYFTNTYDTRIVHWFVEQQL